MAMAGEWQYKLTMNISIYQLRNSNNTSKAVTVAITIAITIPTLKKVNLSGEKV